MISEYRLSKQWVDYLKKKPETGTGYQITDLYLKDCILRGIIIFNCEMFKSKKAKLDLSTIEKIVLKD